MVVLLGKPEFLGSRGRILTVASYAAVCLCQEIIQEILFVPQPTCAAWDDELALSCVRGSRDRTLAHAARRSASTRNATDATLTVYAAPGPSQDQGVDSRSLALAVLRADHGGAQSLDPSARYLTVSVPRPRSEARWNLSNDTIPSDPRTTFRAPWAAGIPVCVDELQHRQLLTATANRRSSSR
jgi:hypothetical protein